MKSSFQRQHVLKSPADMSQEAPLALICGNGTFPAAIAQTFLQQARPFTLIGLRGVTEISLEPFPHLWVRLGELGHLFHALESRHIRQVSFIGGIHRPSLKDLALDRGALKHLPDIVHLLKVGDDGALRTLIHLFEKQDYQVIGVQNLVPDFLMDRGLLTSHRLTSQDQADIQKGQELLKVLSPFDIGQAVVIAKGRVLAMEGAEGTDALLDRIGQLRENGRLTRDNASGILIKGPKFQQELRADLPCIGEETLQRAHKAKLRGVALAADQVLLLHKAQVLRKAEESQLFLYGF